jgi:hypothetical protein
MHQQQRHTPPLAVLGCKVWNIPGVAYSLVHSFGGSVNQTPLFTKLTLPAFSAWSSAAHFRFVIIMQLTQMAMAVSMHLDEHTFTRMQSLFQYFPRPFPESARTASSSSSGRSSSEGAAPAAHGAGGSGGSSSSSSSGGSYTSNSSTSYPGGVSNNSSSSSNGLKGVWVPLSNSGPGPHASAGVAGAAAAAAAGDTPDAAAGAQRSSSSSSSSEESPAEAPSVGRYGPSGGHGRMRD